MKCVITIASPLNKEQMYKIPYFYLIPVVYLNTCILIGIKFLYICILKLTLFLTKLIFL